MNWICSTIEREQNRRLTQIGAVGYGWPPFCYARLSDCGQRSDETTTYPRHDPAPETRMVRLIVKPKAFP